MYIIHYRSCQKDRNIMIALINKETQFTKNKVNVIFERQLVKNVVKHILMCIVLFFKLVSSHLTQIICR